jgi:hypothetical protein
VFKLGVDLKWVAEASREYVHLMLLDEALAPGHKREEFVLVLNDRGVLAELH